MQSTLPTAVRTHKPGAARAHYVARCGADAIDEGGPLVPFLAGIDAAFPSLEEDVCVWLEGDDCPPRVVCVIRPGVEGNLVTWI